MKDLWRIFHLHSETMAVQALVLSKTNPEAAKKIYKLAAIAEEFAFFHLSADQERTRAITFVSMASLYYKAGDASKVEELVQEWSGKLPQWAEHELQSIVNERSQCGKAQSD